MEIKNHEFNCLKVDFYSPTIRSILNCCTLDMHMPAMILALCTIDYIGIPLSRNKDNKSETFKEFLKKYISLVNCDYNNPEIQEIIYAIRCSLVHTYGTSRSLKRITIKPVFETGNKCNKNHLSFFINENGEKCFYISIFDFISETIAGVEAFFRTISDPQILTEWYKNLFIMNDFSGLFNKAICISGDKIFYKNIHSFLSILDEKPDCSIKELANSINDKLITNYNNSIR